MNTLYKITLTLTGSLFLALPTLADTTHSQWGEWNLKQANKDAFFTAQTFSDVELIQPNLSVTETFDQGNMMGTQLTGTPYQGLDTDPSQFELNEQGVPIELLGGPIPVDVGSIDLNENGIPFELAQHELNAHEYN